MEERISSKISVRVETFYMEQMSDSEGHFFKYRIHLHNQGNQTVRLILRHWYISELLSEPREVSGHGVVGEMPILQPGDSYSYTSSVQIKSNVGFMRGSYTFENLNKKSLFKVQVPKFQLFAKETYN